MEEWTTFALANFLPFTAEVYLRLIEQVNDAWWPLHLATFALGAVALALGLTGHRRFVGPLLALLWTWTAYGFLQAFYAELNWAGIWFARGFYLQAVILAFLFPFICRETGTSTTRFRTGLLLAGTGLIWPLITMVGRESPYQLEVVGIHPDPTAILALGLLLLTLQSRWLWLFIPVPLLWCLISGLSAQVLGLPQVWPLLAIPALAVFAVLWRPIKTT